MAVTLMLLRVSSVPCALLGTCGPFHFPFVNDVNLDAKSNLVTFVDLYWVH